ncbi:U3 small nucleolar RNA-associated protein [Drechslerella dactyloides]|uniref:U3 small nucleolar RNA-associated protein n=1 Tax=Drechslerella dactyloides TaxID=74499 RepID=A0AAD6J398_DREDA|nr:U3 small nucleolar RNA-associated protein [Drechslerella dactyloides]
MPSVVPHSGADELDSHSEASDLADPVESLQSPATLLQAVGAFSAAAASTRKRKRGAPGLNKSSRTSHFLPGKLDSSDVGTTSLLHLGSRQNQINGSKVSGQTVSSDDRHRLEAPTPDALQLRQNRQAAYKTTKETLDRWLDTVKSMRDAEQLTFPIARQTKDSCIRNPVPLSAPPLVKLGKPAGNLESKVALALSADVQGSDSNLEKQILTASSKRTRADKRAQVAHLRMERELIIRREAKAKRLKRIKSKTYRRILKRDAQRIANKMGEFETEIDDDSLASATNDSSTREGIAPENGDPEELRLQQYNGKPTRTSESHLSKMKFMADAEERRLRIENIDTMADPSGRRIFHKGLGNGATKAGALDHRSTTIQSESDRSNGTPSSRANPGAPSAKPALICGDTNPWLAKNADTASDETKANYKAKAAPTDPDPGSMFDARESNIPGSLLIPRTSTDQSSPNSHLVSSSPGLYPSLQSSHKKSDLLLRAFAGDNVLQEVLKDVDVQDTSEVDRPSSSLPGWGTWSSLTRPARGSSKAKKDVTKPSFKSGKVIISNKYSKKVPDDPFLNVSSKRTATDNLMA